MEPNSWDNTSFEHIYLNYLNVFDVPRALEKARLHPIRHISGMAMSGFFGPTPETTVAGGYLVRSHEGHEVIRGHFSVELN